MFNISWREDLVDWFQRTIKKKAESEKFLTEFKWKIVQKWLNLNVIKKNKSTSDF